MPPERVSNSINKGELWQCPRCERFFAKKNQSHSCVVYSIDDHFMNKPPRLREAFDYLLSKLETFGPLRTDAVKSAVNITGHYHFIMLYVQKNALNIEFALDRKKTSERINKTQKLGKDRYTYYVKVADKAEVDDELLGWLEESYHLTAFV